VEQHRQQLHYQRVVTRRDDDDDDEIRAPGSDEPLTLCVDAYDEIEKACGEDM